MEDYGYKPSSDFEPSLQAAIARMRAGQARQRGQLAQSIASKGVRTSGVGLIPAQDLERGFSEAEAGLTGDFARHDAQERINDRRRQEDFQFDREMLERSGELQRTIARRQLQGELWGAGAGLVGGAARAALKKYYA